jgi:K+-transporting ATPase KdpF subunit
MSAVPLAAFGADVVVGLLVALAVCVYLVYALLRGEDL